MKEEEMKITSTKENVKEKMMIHKKMTQNMKEEIKIPNTSLNLEEIMRIQKR